MLNKKYNVRYIKYSVIYKISTLILKTSRFLQTKPIASLIVKKLIIRKPLKQFVLL